MRLMIPAMCVNPSTTKLGGYPLYYLLGCCFDVPMTSYRCPLADWPSHSMYFFAVIIIFKPNCCESTSLVIYHTDVPGDLYVTVR